MNTNWLVVELLDRQDRGDLLVLHRAARRLTIGLPRAIRAALRHVVDLEPVDAAAVGEAQDVVVRVGDEQLLDEIVFLGRRRLLAAAAALLRAVLGDRLRLHVAAVRQRDDHVLRRDQVLDRRGPDALRDDLACGARRRTASRSPPARRAMIVVTRAGLARMSRRSTICVHRPPGTRRRSCPARGRSGAAAASRGSPAPARRTAGSRPRCQPNSGDRPSGRDGVRRGALQHLLDQLRAPGASPSARPCASAGVGAALMSAMISSTFDSATARPSSTWPRSRALRSSKTRAARRRPRGGAAGRPRGTA